MNRFIEKALIQWKNQKNLMPLVMRGARQVGKTFIIEKFGREHFEEVVTVNFEYQPEMKDCFKTMNPRQIINLLAALTKQRIQPGKTLLFFDEIQDCPEAIKSLRYFKEKLPTLHVIAAGSLLEFVLNDANFRMPVGRIQFIYLKPLSFKEFLIATNNKEFLHFIENFNFKKKIPVVIHNALLQLVREYMVLGGMPAVISEYTETKNITQCQILQTSLLNTFQNDFGKYASRAQYKYLQMLFNKAPALIAEQFKYSKVDNETRSRDLKIALEQLAEAGLIIQVFATSASGLPLSALINEKKFKLLFLDVGLMNRATGLSTEILLSPDLILVNRGAIAEQFVGQEILANGNFFEKTNLFYWSREQKGSSAEVDFVVQIDSQITGIEVKSGTSGRLKSLHLFLEDKKLPFGIQISQKEFSWEKNIISLPLYLTSEIARLVLSKHTSYELSA